MYAPASYFLLENIIVSAFLAKFWIKYEAAITKVFHILWLIVDAFIWFIDFLRVTKLTTFKLW